MQNIETKYKHLYKTKNNEETKNSTLNNQIIQIKYKTKDKTYSKIQNN